MPMRKEKQQLRMKENQEKQKQKNMSNFWPKIGRGRSRNLKSGRLREIF